MLQQAGLVKQQHFNLRIPACAVRMALSMYDSDKQLLCKLSTFTDAY